MVSKADSARIKALEKENAELRRANAIRRTASAFFAAELDATDHGTALDRPKPLPVGT